jgi:hypothetical protein
MEQPPSEDCSRGMGQVGTMENVWCSTVETENLLAASPVKKLQMAEGRALDRLGGGRTPESQGGSHKPPFQLHDIHDLLH